MVQIIKEINNKIIMVDLVVVEEVFDEEENNL